MTEYMKKSYRWFTIIELLSAIIIISVALLSILWLLRVAVTYTNKTRQETIAINLAREAIEWVYNRRNTNWLKRSWEKDKYRLCIDTGCSARFENNTLYKLVPSNWSFWKEINFKKVATYNPYWSASPYPYWSASPYWSSSSVNTNIELLLWSWDFIWWESPDAAWKFYRAIIGLGLYLKDSGTVWGDMITCPNGNANYGPWDSCSDNKPKEYRFCSRVQYEKDMKWSVELCGSITNYQE